MDEIKWTDEDFQAWRAGPDHPEILRLRARIAEQDNTIRQLLRINANLVESMVTMAAPIRRLYAQGESGPSEVGAGGPRAEDQREAPGHEHDPARSGLPR
jgi:hypothetical protein